MTLPNYKRPFEPEDFRGYFKWTETLSKKLKNNFLYHACHKEELLDILDRCDLALRSNWSINLPEHGLCEVPGVWCGLNSFANGNYYGPFVIKFPLSVLQGKQFIAFRRGSRAERKRYFFVQYDAMIPIYSFKGDIWRRVDSDAYFSKDDGRILQLMSDAIYDIVLTSMISLRKAISIYGVKHDRCIPNKCGGVSSVQSRRTMREIAKEIFKTEITKAGIIDNIIERYPDVAGETVVIPIE